MVAGTIRVFKARLCIAMFELYLSHDVCLFFPRSLILYHRPAFERLNSNGTTC